MHPFSAQTAFITGAASGIGQALAHTLAAQACHLALADIQVKALTQLQASLQIQYPALRITPHVLDVADRTAFFQVRDEALEAHGQISVLINNAGVSLTGKIADLDIADMRWLMDINYWGVVHGTQAFLPHLLTQPKAWLANISSIFGIVGVPGQAAYNAAKFAVKGFTEALRKEMADQRQLRVSCVHPGGVRTQIVRAGRFADKGLSEADQALVKDRFDQIARLSPDQAARKILRGMSKGKKRILVGLDARLLDGLARFFPVAHDSVVLRLTRGTTLPPPG